MRVFILAVLLFPALAAAQTAAPHEEDLGTVTGHVVCADTQRPARAAQVRLIRVPSAQDVTGNEATSDHYKPDLLNNALPVETDMDGAFTFRHLTPGRYFVRVDLAGYLTPLTEFTAKEIASPTPDVRQRMDHDLQVITVQPHASVQADVTLQRAGVISGTVRYDDGSPAIGITLSLHRRGADGKFSEDVSNGRYIPPADDRGQFRFDSLPAGEYQLAANLSLNEYTESTLPMPTGGGRIQVNMTKTLFSLAIYFGDALRSSQATPIKLAAGDDMETADISIPLSKLHRVSGTLTTSGGHIVNAGKLKLLYADDRSQLTSVDVSHDDGSFVFSYVPEGNYILQVSEARDVTEVEVLNAPGVTPRTHTEEKTVRTYGSGEQPLVVQDDVTSIVATVPEKSTSASPATTPSE